MASKIKKALKKIGKAAIIAGAGYAAMKGLKNRKENKAFLKENKAFLKTEGGDKSDMRDYGPFTKTARKMPATGNMYGDGNPKNRNVSYALKSGGRAGYKSGGKSKPKSIGKALRGGGKVMR